MLNMKASLVIKNANLITVNKNNDIEEAIGVKDNKIIYVGSNKGVEEYEGPDTKIIDAKGRTVTPGLIETHLHFLMYGSLDNGVINVTYPAAKSIEDLKNIIKEEAAKKDKGEWIKLQGYDHNKLKEGRHPTREDFDEVAPDNPVQCTRICAHMGVYNSLALEIGEIVSEDQYGEDEVVVDANGVPEGLLKETAHMELAKKVIISDEELLSALKNASNIMLENGITTIHDAGTVGAPAYKMMQKASENGDVKVRMRFMIFDMFGKDSNIELIETFINSGLYTGMGNEKFTIGPAKIMTDGSSSGPSASMLEPYSHDDSSKGILVWEQEEADEILGKAHKAGFQVTAHAVGDNAVTIIVNAIEKALKENPREDHRHRIDHCGITNPELINRIADLGIIPISNPAFISINGKDYNKFYGDRVEYMFPLKSYLDKGIITTVASDAPVTHPNPMYSFYGATTRKDYVNQEVVGEEQIVDIMDVIRMFTYNGAYASFEEDIKGSLEVGKLADITMFSENILDYEKEKLFDIKVDFTIVDGIIEYER